MELFINTIKQFMSLNESDLALLKKVVLLQKLGKNSFFIKEGQVCNKIAFIESGMLRHFYYSENKCEVTRWVSLKNTFFTSFESFIMRTPSYENIQAIKNSTILTISQKDWQLLCEYNPLFKELWIKNIEFHYIGMEERVFSLIALKAEQRYELLCNKYPEFIKEVPLKYIASMLGIEPRHLSRIRKSIK